MQVSEEEDAQLKNGSGAAVSTTDLRGLLEEERCLTTSLKQEVEDLSDQVCQHLERCTWQLLMAVICMCVCRLKRLFKLTHQPYGDRWS